MKTQLNETHSIVKKRRLAIAAIGVLSILGAAGVISIQHMGEIAAIDRSADVAVSDPANPRWNTMRMPASERRLQEHSSRKSEGLIHTEISAPDGAVETGKPFRLKGIARVRTSIDELHYIWILPEGVRLRSGTLQGSITGVASGEAREFDVELETLAPANHRILFRAWRVRNGESIGNTATYLTGLDTQEAPEASMQKLNSPAAKQPLAPRSPEEFRKRAIQ